MHHHMWSVLALVGLLFIGSVLSLEKKADRLRRNRLDRIKKQNRARTLDPDKFLEKFGYLTKIQHGVQHSPSARREAIRNFQRMVGLRANGRLDDVTREKMLAPRCGLPDVVPLSGTIPPDAAGDAPNMAENYFVPGYKWKKTSLTWRALNYSPDLDSGSQRRALHNAFRVWSDVTPLRFDEIGSGTSDIDIMFGSYDHGDGGGNSFDGPSGVLAHAFYPENGDTHFDESETWVDGAGDGMDLFTVAAHEFGHALGLGHSNVNGALMAPYYQGYDPDFRLHDDDRMAIQSLYGSAPRPAATTTPAPRATESSIEPTKKPSTRPDSCTVKFNAVMQAHDGRIYVFWDSWIWRLHDWGMEEGFPKRVTWIFPGAPYRIAAAVYSWRTRYTYFFKGNKVWKYYGFEQLERKALKYDAYPRPQAAVMGRDGRIYLLKYDQFWEFDEQTMDLTDRRGRPLSEMWPGLPANIEASVRLRDGYLYFFKGTRYRKYDEYYRRVLDGYPKEKAAPWMGPACGGAYVPK